MEKLIFHTNSQGRKNNNFLFLKIEDVPSHLLERKTKYWGSLAREEEGEISSQGLFVGEFYANSKGYVAKKRRLTPGPGKGS